MSDFRMYRDALAHRKQKVLRRRRGPEATYGWIDLLGEVSEEAPTGYLEGWGPEEVWAACGAGVYIDAEPEELLEDLVDLGIIDVATAVVPPTRTGLRDDAARIAELPDVLPLRGALRTALRGAVQSAAGNAVRPALRDVVQDALQDGCVLYLHEWRIHQPHRAEADARSQCMKDLAIRRHHGDTGGPEEEGEPSRGGGQDAKRSAARTAKRRAARSAGRSRTAVRSDMPPPPLPSPSKEIPPNPPPDDVAASGASADPGPPPPPPDPPPSSSPPRRLNPRALGTNPRSLETHPRSGVPTRAAWLAECRKLCADQGRNYQGPDWPGGPPAFPDRPPPFLSALAAVGSSWSALCERGPRDFAEQVEALRQQIYCSAEPAPAAAEAGQGQGPSRRTQALDLAPDPDQLSALTPSGLAWAVERLAARVGPDYSGPWPWPDLPAVLGALDLEWPTLVEGGRESVRAHAPAILEGLRDLRDETGRQA